MFLRRFGARDAVFSESVFLIVVVAVRGRIGISSLHLFQNESLERVRGVVTRKNFERLKIARGRDLGGGPTGLLRSWKSLLNFESFVVVCAERNKDREVEEEGRRFKSFELVRVADFESL